MRLWFAPAVVAFSMVGCGDNDDDVGKKKTPIPMDQVPPNVLKAAKEAAPDLTFFAAYQDTFQGQDSIELKGKNKLGKIKEIEVSPEGKVLGSE
jgi:hypothetical protein